jgi:hypothetical protein
VWLCTDLRAPLPRMWLECLTYEFRVNSFHVG